MSGSYRRLAAGMAALWFRGAAPPAEELLGPPVRQNFPAPYSDRVRPGPLVNIQGIIRRGHYDPPGRPVSLIWITLAEGAAGYGRTFVYRGHFLGVVFDRQNAFSIATFNARIIANGASWNVRRISAPFLIVILISRFE